MQVQRWQLITSLDNLAEQLNLSKMQIRTSLDKLVSTWEIHKKVTNRFTMLTVLKYCDYNDTEIKDNTQITHKQHTDNTQITPTKEYKNNKNEKELKETYYIKEVEDFILAQKDNIAWIRYQIEKQWFEKYINKQNEAYNKILSYNKIDSNSLNTILQFVLKDWFWNKQIWSITKLLEKNKDWTPYWVVMIDKIKTQVDNRPSISLI